MSTEVHVKIGRKLSETERRQITWDEIAVLHPLPPRPAEIEGQEMVYQAVMCPYCGAISYHWMDTEIYTAVYCPYCCSVYCGPEQ